MNFTLNSLLIAVCLAVASSHAVAAVTAEEAAKLKSSLTPFGAERAGNKDGTIPSWEGGWAYTPQTNGKIPDLFADEKPSFTITAQNMEKYADKLSDGTKALLKKFPTYRVVVYPTRRTSAAPQWVYDNTFKNATRATIDPSGKLGPFPRGAFGGIPFPIPKTGEEAIWNHHLKWVGEAFINRTEQGRVTPEGKMVVIQQARGVVNFSYYDSSSTLEKWEAAGAIKDLRRGETLGPPIRSGELSVFRQAMNDADSAGYVYLTGQRRVRRLPLTCCDVPNPLSGGLANFDELGEVYAGAIGRYNWKLVGKQEMYIPYNSNKYAQPKTLAETIPVPHPSPDLIRHELHRVWVVEATLKPGERHTAPKVRVYLDEDSWMGVIADRWDAQGQLWKASFTLPAVWPQLPAVGGVGSLIFDLIRGGYYAATYNVAQENQLLIGKPQPDRIFTPDSLTAEGVR